MERFWQGRKVLLTGHTGFKGTWAALWLQTLGAEVTGLALAPRTVPNFWSIAGAQLESHIGDLRDAAFVERVIAAARPEIVIHMAAQALVRDSYADPIYTFATNIMGTANLLQACRRSKNLACVLVVTSDKVYENHGEGRPFSEADRLGGHDPYSNSKACTELVTQSFRDSFFTPGPPIATARAGNVIGGGDWSADRLVPDCVRALAVGQPVSLRYPKAIRPWQHVLEPVGGYLALAEALVDRPQSTPLAMNFGPDPAAFRTVAGIVEAFSRRFAGKPGWVQDGGQNPPEAAALTLSSGLARQALGWRPALDIDATLAWTADWYRAHLEGQDMRGFSLAQIAGYQNLPGRAPGQTDSDRT
jgi:CDP-glucose 4,6-dehydratase